MKKQALLILIMGLAGLMAVYGCMTQAAALTGRDVMLRVDNRDDGETRWFELKLNLLNKSGDKRVRVIDACQKDYGKDIKSIMIFQSPADVKGTAYLSWEYDNQAKRDDRWLYLPALRKIRRISGSSSNDYFMGTDFTYDDLGGKNIDEETHTLLREEEIAGRKCWVVKSVPKKKGSEYTQKTLWVAQDLDMAIKVEYMNKRGLLKTLEVKDIERIDGIWTAKKMVMTNKQEGHTTILEYLNMKYNIPLRDDLFRTAMMERGNLGDI
jgi:outer membrane lipoprotein-sorting protein